MQALNLYRPPIDSGPSNRRVWSYPDLQSHSLLTLTPGELYLAPNTGQPRPEFVEAAEGDGDLDELFGPLATVIELVAVQRARLDLLTNSLTLDIMRARKSSRIVLTFATPEAADSCFSRIWRRLGNGCKLLSHHPDWRPLARMPLISFAMVLAITAILSLTLSMAEDMPATGAAASVNVPGEPVVLSGPLGKLNWRWVCAAGGAAAAVTQVWLYRRLTQPPISLEVVRT